MDVPWKLLNPPPGTDELITAPGASKDKNVALLENDETASATAPKEPSPVEPTLTAVEIHEGKEMALTRESLPAAMTVAIFADLRRSMIGFLGSLSQFVAEAPPPKLKLTAAKL
jgi:hypothetical protein